ncbi:Alcohol dehydrogenase [Phytophthora palmivora]|uniref:Alcohol dehydrogenase n=1 Tax=Phytophthora palmivora TaxID=4796 RepID=A0A2P4XK56_9STRA|nr:Alcohol dehydrogenase [Phytophthora palmivora]
MSKIPATFKVYQYEMRVKVFSAALNPIDYKMIQYGPALVSTKPTPEKLFRLGFDLAGKVVELSSDVKDYKIGDEVYAVPWIDALGSFGEYINVNIKFLAPTPTNMSWNEAAGIAKAVGAEVITTCSHRNVELVKSLGADQVINYTKEKWSDVLGEHSVDLIYDCGYDGASWNDVAQKTLKEKTGIFVTILSVDNPIDSPIGATLHQIINAPCTEFLLELKKLIEADKLKTIIDSVHLLENVLDAMKICLSRRAKGKIIIEVAKH